MSTVCPFYFIFIVLEAICEFSKIPFAFSFAFIFLPI